ncbi:MAG: polysaccharide biosynthesis tyrosine autokinase [Vulcanimicrobiaceae bacterium]
MINRVNPSSPLATGAPNGVLYPHDAPSEGNRELDFGLLWKAVVRRRALFFAVLAVFVAAVAIFTLVQPKLFTTQAKLIVGSASGVPGAANGNGAQSLPILNALLSSNGVQTSETYAELIQQIPVAREVARRLRLNVPAGELLSRIQVKPVPDTAILAISSSWRDPMTSAKIANGFAAVFVERERELVTHQADGAIKFLQVQLPAAEQKLTAAQAALSAYQQEVQIVDLPAQTTSLINAQATLDAKQNAVELEGRQAAASLEVVLAQLAQTPRTIVGQEQVSANPVSAQLDTQITTLQSQLAAARAQYTEDYPTVVSLRQQLAAAQKEKSTQPRQVLSGTQTVPNPLYQQLSTQAATLQAQVSAAQAQLSTVRGQVNATKPALDRLPEQARRISELQRNAKSAQDIYDALHRKYQDATLSKTTAISDVSITQPADPASSSKSPNLILNLLLGFVVGIVLALVAVFLAEFFDDRFRTETDVKTRLGLPVLATIPQLGTGNAKESTWTKPLSAEAFYQLVASLRYSSETPPRTIAFTSPDQGDGKSTVAVNTALSIGLMKARVLIIDADLRRPTIHQKLNITNDRGLSDVLVGVAPLADVIKPTEHPGVSVMTSGRSAPNPVALLQSDAFDRLLKGAAERFDYVIVDGPALRSIIDGVVLGNKTDGTVLVISAQHSEGRSVQSALGKLRSLGSVNLLGVVLNGTRPDERDHNDYYLGGGQSISLSASPSD